MCGGALQLHCIRVPGQCCESCRGLRSCGFVSDSTGCHNPLPTCSSAIVATFVVTSGNFFYFVTEAGKKPVGSSAHHQWQNNTLANLIPYETMNLPCVQAAAPASQGVSMPQEMAPGWDVKSCNFIPICSHSFPWNRCTNPLAHALKVLDLLPLY